MVEQIVSSLQAGPGPSPIIVIQSDEGPYPPASDQSSEILNWSWSKASDVELGRKLRILNAYYLPGDLRTRPYPSITPVNTFRLILNDYFGAELPLLPDRTYVSPTPTTSTILRMSPTDCELADRRERDRVALLDRVMDIGH